MWVFPAKTPQGKGFDIQQQSVECPRRQVEPVDTSFDTLSDRECFVKVTVNLAAVTTDSLFVSFNHFFSSGQPGTDSPKKTKSSKYRRTSDTQAYSD